MSKSNLHALSQPEMTSNDPLHELIRQGARDLIARAVETELEGLLSQYADIKTADGRQAVVRNGYLPKRTIQTGVGDV
ncbi:IS256 family transposase, partial [Stutzerimonas stutzeri]